MQINPKIFSYNTYYAVAVKDSLAFFAGITESLKTLNYLGKAIINADGNGQTINTIYIDTD